MQKIQSIVITFIVIWPTDNNSLLALIVVELMFFASLENQVGNFLWNDYKNIRYYFCSEVGFGFSLFLLLEHE